MFILMAECSLRTNTFQGIGQTNDLQLWIEPDQCEEYNDYPIQIALQLGTSISLSPQNSVFKSTGIVFVQRIDTAIFTAALTQTFGQFQVTLESGQVLTQSFTQIQFTNQNLTNCWENVYLAYTADKGNLGFNIIVQPASCEFSSKVSAQLMYQNQSGSWNSIVIKSGGTYDSEDYDHMTTLSFQRLCVGVFTEDEIKECNKFIEHFQEYRTMKMKLVINYEITGIEVSVQGSITNYYTPQYLECMKKMDITVFITQIAAIVSFSADGFLECNFNQDDIILTMEIDLVSGDFNYNQRKNFSLSETLYFPQASFNFEEEILAEMFGVKDPFTAHFFLTFFDQASVIQQEASYFLNSTVTCYNFINFSVSKDKVCANMKFNYLMTSCTFASTIPVTFKGMWVTEKAPPLAGKLLPVFEMKKDLDINYDLVEQSVCMTCKDQFIGGDCNKILPKFAKFYVKNPMYVLIGVESLENAYTDFKIYTISFSTDIYLSMIIGVQAVIAGGLFLAFGSYMCYIKIQEEKRNL